MLSFIVTGSIGCVLASAPDELTLAISSTFERANEPPRVAWVLCVARAVALRAEIHEHFREGDLVRVEGAIEQRRRQTGELAFHSVGFIAYSIEKLRSATQPKA